jgi:hypothetical protein
MGTRLVGWQGVQNAQLIIVLGSNRDRYSVVLALAIVVNQEIPSDTHHPGHKLTTVRIVATQVSEHFDEHVLSQVFCLINSSDEPKAQVINPFRVTDDQFFPG